MLRTVQKPKHELQHMFTDQPTVAYNTVQLKINRTLIALCIWEFTANNAGNATNVSFVNKL